MSKKELRTYGHGDTIHGTNHVDVEVDKNGHVVAVWFRCCPIPFKQSLANEGRAESMNNMYKDNAAPKLHAIIVED